jgi:predicted ATP-dependent serine protease
LVRFFSQTDKVVLMKLLDVSKSKYHGKNINDVIVPPELRVKLATGIPFIDVALGGGYTPSTAWMVTGDAGCGKSTLMLTIANAFTKQGHVVLYNGREESVFQVRIATERLGLSDGFFFGEDLFVHDLVDHAKKLQARLAAENKSLPIDKQRRVIVIVDSLQCLDSGKYDTGRKTKNTPVQCAQELIKWVKCEGVPEKERVYGVMSFINHVTKSGNFSGENTLLHAVDAHLHFGFDRNKKSEMYGERVLTKLKDRFGPAAPPICLEMGEGGRLAMKEVEENQDLDEEIIDGDLDAVAE